MAHPRLMTDHQYIADQQCRITVVGQRRRVDLAVPAAAPIAEYLMTVARLCGALGDEEPGEDSLPGAWSLAATGGDTIPLDLSLTDAGILDGQVLYLRDAAADGAGGPVVTDIDEAVADAAARYAWAWTSASWAAAFLAVGTAWLTGALIALAVLASRLPAGGPRLVAGLGLLAALASTAAARRARQASWPRPVWLPTALALSAVPQLAAAGTLLTSAHATPAQVALAAAAGAFGGALLALSARPGAVTTGVVLITALGVGVTACLAVLAASGVQCAAAVAVAAMWLYDLAPVSVARLVARTGTAGVTSQVRQAQYLATAWQAALAVTEALALCWLAGSDLTFALALAGCVSLVMLLAAGGYRQLGGVLPGLVAGATGLLALLLLLPGRVGAQWWVGPVLCLAAGFALLAGTAIRSFRDESAPEPAAWRGPVAALLRVVSIPLLVGIFGAFGQLVIVGHRL
jgi:hypothetical protein